MLLLHDAAQGLLRKFSDTTMCWFVSECACEGTAPSEAPAREVPPPEDGDLRKMIEAMAPFVARNGAAFEALAVRRNARDSRFGFLKGGPGAEYYRWRVQAGRPRQALAVEACTKMSAQSLSQHINVVLSWVRVYLTSPSMMRACPGGEAGSAGHAGRPQAAQGAAERRRQGRAAGGGAAGSWGPQHRSAGCREARRLRHCRSVLAW